MGMNHKMVNLCDASYDAACRMDNFSGWVRTQTLKLDRQGPTTALDDMSSKQLMSVVLNRNQNHYGFNDEFVSMILELLQNKQLV